MKQLELLWTISSLISRFCVLYIEDKRSMCMFAGKASSDCRFLDREWTRNILISLSGQNSNSEDCCWSISLHSGLFCNSASSSKFTKQPPAFFLNSSKLKEKKQMKVFQLCLSQEPSRDHQTFSNLLLSITWSIEGFQHLNLFKRFRSQRPTYTIEKKVQRQRNAAKSKQTWTTPCLRRERSSKGQRRVECLSNKIKSKED